MKLNFRQGDTQDVKQLRELALASYGCFEDEMTSDNWSVFYDNLDAEASYINILKIATCFVCEHNDNIVGVAYFIPSGNPTKIFESDWCYMRMVGVHPDYQGNGIGVELIKRCIAYARQINEKIMALHTSEFMDAARAIYGKLGFTQIRELPLLYGKKYWLYRLEL